MRVQKIMGTLAGLLDFFILKYYFYKVYKFHRELNCFNLKFAADLLSTILYTNIYCVLYQLYEDFPNQIFFFSNQKHGKPRTLNCFFVLFRAFNCQKSIVNTFSKSYHSSYYLYHISELWECLSWQQLEFFWLSLGVPWMNSRLKKGSSKFL